MMSATAFERVQSIFLGGIFDLYTYFLSVGMSPFRCLRQDDGTYTLAPSSSYDCFDAKWFNNWFIVSLGLLQLIVFPLIMVWAFCKHRSLESRQSNSFVWRYANLVRDYKPEFYWWGLFMLVKKTLLVVVIDSTNGSSSYIRTFITLLLLILAMAIESFCKPRLCGGSLRLLYNS